MNQDKPNNLILGYLVMIQLPLAVTLVLVISFIGTGAIANAIDTGDERPAMAKNLFAIAGLAALLSIPAMCWLAVALVYGFTS